MATYPPPSYPPPVGPPPGFDPRLQRRLQNDHIRAQARAQKQSYRAQRELYRLQARAMRRGSILGPLLVITFGVLLLALSAGWLRFDRFAAWYGHWWPLSLIAAGLLLALEWTFDQRPQPAGQGYVRRGIGGGVGFLLILLALTGAAFSSVQHFHERGFQGFSINGDNFGQLFGEKHDLQQQIDRPFPLGTSLSIDNPHGDVTIVGRSDDSQIHIVVNKEVSSWSDADARNRGEQLAPQLNLSGSTLNITLPSQNGSSADLSITVPDSASTAVIADHGAVTISSMHASVNITANHGEVAVSSISGPVAIHVNHDSSSVSAHEITGDLSVNGHAEDLNLAEISGHVTLAGDFYGDTHLEHLHGPVTFDTSRTHLALARLGGEIEVSPSSELTGNQIVGPIELRSRNRNLALNEVSGDLSITNNNGSVDVTTNPLSGAIKIENQNGAVNLTVPEQTGFRIDAETTNGGVNNDFSLSSTSDHDNTSLRGTVGNGAGNVTIRTSHADISLHKGTAAIVPTPAAPLDAPASKVKLSHT